MLYLRDHPSAGKDGMVYEHVLVAEENLGRSLKEGEEVHHEDRNRANNSPENLFVFRSKSDHARYHMNNLMILAEDGSYISPEVIYYNICVVCGKEYPKKQNSIHCSNICSGYSNRKAERPTAWFLRHLLEQGSFVSVGKFFSVSDNAVRKWCKSYGMSTSSKDY